MSRVFGFFLFALLLTSPIAASELPRFELNGGYSYNRIEEVNFYGGWDAGFTWYFCPFAGVTADVSGCYKSEHDEYFDAEASVNQHKFLGGPQFAYRGHRWVKPFARFLVGVSYVRAHVDFAGDWESASDTAFCLGGGGGLDLNVHESLAIRLIQYDYLRLTGDQEGNQHRLACGVVFLLDRPYRAAPRETTRQPSAAPPPVPSAQPQAPAYTGEMVPVSVTSEPAGASVFINERFAGLTPTLIQLPPQRVRVRLFLFGYRDWVQEVDVTKENSTIKAVLER